MKKYHGTALMERLEGVLRVDQTPEKPKRFLRTKKQPPKNEIYPEIQPYAVPGSFAFNS